MTPELIVSIGTAIAAVIGAFYAHRHLPAIHKAVNSQYGNSLLTGKVSADTLREKFPENAEYARLAAIATAAYEDHLRQQGVADTAAT